MFSSWAGLFKNSKTLIMKIKIKKLQEPEMNDPNYVNLTVGSQHDTVPAPEPIRPSDSIGVWVMGSISETKLFPDEYEIVGD